MRAVGMDGRESGRLYEWSKVVLWVLGLGFHFSFVFLSLPHTFPYFQNQKYVSVYYFYNWDQGISNVILGSDNES